MDEYGQDLPVTENHRLIARLPVETVWTTNYDRLIEKAFRGAGKRCEAKVASENFGITLRGKDVTVYKMHGDVSQPQDAMLTKEDYELYNVHREVFTNALKGDLVNKTFLFLGFSFTDPNIDYILSRIRVLLAANPRQHYCIMKRAEQAEEIRQRPGGLRLRDAQAGIARRRHGGAMGSRRCWSTTTRKSRRSCRR